MHAGLRPQSILHEASQIDRFIRQLLRVNHISSTNYGHMIFQFPRETDGEGAFFDPGEAITQRVLWRQAGLLILIFGFQTESTIFTQEIIDTQSMDTMSACIG